MEGRKDDSGKCRWSLLLTAAIGLEGVIKVLEFGAKKYKEDSWKTVPDGELRYREALLRHQIAVVNGEEIDAESGLPHEYHIACNAIFIAWYVAKRRSGQPKTKDAEPVVGSAHKESIESTRFGPSFPAGSDQWQDHNSQSKPTGILSTHVVDVIDQWGRDFSGVPANRVMWTFVTKWRAAQ